MAISVSYPAWSWRRRASLFMASNRSARPGTSAARCCDHFHISFGAALARFGEVRRSRVDHPFSEYLNAGPESIVDRRQLPPVWASLSALRRSAALPSLRRSAARFMAWSAPILVVSSAAALRMARRSSNARFLSSAAARSPDVHCRFPTQLDASTMLPLVVRNIPELGRIARRRRHGN